MLEEFVAQNPNDSFARYGLALEMGNAGDTEGAIAQFEALTGTNADYTAAYQMWAQMLIKTQRSDEARSVLEKGIACAQRTGNQHAEREMRGMLEEMDLLG
ncbi:MAG: hypothetical protein NVS9B15_09790 [Acidobacteriaceae bacterium]